MATDPYELLGVDKAASAEDIRKAYRNVAKKFHPDLNPGDKNAEAKFKEVAAAYDILGDAEKRARFDRGEIDATGAERPRQRYYREYAQTDGPDNPYASDAGFADFTEHPDFGNAQDIFSEIFRRESMARRRRPGADVQYRLPVSFLDAVNGATRTVRMADGTSLDVTIPPGVDTGKILRLRGKGMPSPGEGPPGDALIEIEVMPHPWFRRDGDNIALDLPVTLAEAVLGGKIRVPTPTGAVNMTIPKGSNAGKVLRLRGKGVPRAGGERGDAYVTLKIMLPDEPGPELEEFLARWSGEHPYNPRKAMES